jgi:serine/threonine protein kinase/WD40 repeat protein
MSESHFSGDARDPVTGADPNAESIPLNGLDPTTLDEFLYALRDDARLRPGDVFGAFTIRRLLRTGGMGEAYIAEQAPLGRLTIVKVIRGVGSAESRKRFRNEWRIGGKLHHTNLVPVYAAGRKADRDYYVMPYVRGASLREVIRALRGMIASRKGAHSLIVQKLVADLADAKDRSYLRPWEKLSVEETAVDDNGSMVKRAELPLTYYEWVARRMIEAAHAITMAHRTGVLHLDVKPSNVLIETPSDLAKVLDFGLAQRFQPTDSESPTAVKCQPGGVPGYAAPEIFAGTADCRADVYGLGACLYELVTLSKPTNKYLSSAPADLVAIASKAMAAEPNGRYSSSAGFADDLQRWLDRKLPVARNEWHQAPRAFTLWVRRNVAWTITATVAVLLLLGAAAWGIERSEEGRREAERKRDEIEADKQAIERERDRIALQRRFEQALLDSQEVLLQSPVQAEWSRIARDKLKEIVRLRPDADLRDYAAATFVGIDTAQIFSFHSPQAKNRLSGFSSVAYSPDGTRLVASGWGQPGMPPARAVLWDGNAANKPIESSRPGSGPVAFSDNETPLHLILPVGKEQSLTLWNVGTNTALVEIPLPGQGIVYSAALSADARFAAAFFYPASKGKEKVSEPLTMLWEIDRKMGNTSVKKVSKWPESSTALAFSPDGKLLATGTDSGKVVVRTTSDGVERVSFSEGELAITGLGFGRNYQRPSGQRHDEVGIAEWLLAVGSKGGALSVWSLSKRTRLNAFYGSEHAVFGVAFSPDGTMLASAGRNFPFIWDVASGRPLLRVQHRGGGFWGWTEGVVFSPKGDRVAFGSGEAFAPPGGLDVFRLENDRGIRTYRGLTGVVEKVWLSPTGKWVAALAQNWQLGIWDRATGETAFVWDVPEGITADNSALAFDSNDTEVLFASGERASRWNLKTGERTGSWELPPGLNDSLVTRPGKNPILVRRDPWRSAQMAIRARELGAQGEKTEVYRIADLDARSVNETFQSADGRFLLVNRSGSQGPLLYDGLSGKQLPLDAKGADPKYDSGVVTITGATMRIKEIVGDTVRNNLFRLPALTPLGVHDHELKWIDDAGKLGVNSNPRARSDNGISLYRIGEDRPVVTFDVGRPPNQNSYAISADGRFVYWGRKDGTVCVADVNKCIEQLDEFGKR